MATIFKNTYNIDPLTISQTHLNSYRNLIKSTYGIISSNFFNNERLSSVDYLVLNNNQTNVIQNLFTSFNYKNNREDNVQVALFYGNEIKNKYDYHKKVPYFTTILKSGKKQELPIDENQKTHLYTFDENGKLIDEQIITTNSNR